MDPDLGYAAVEPEVLELCASAARALEEAGAVVEEVALDLDDPYPIFNVFFTAAMVGRTPRTSRRCATASTSGASMSSSAR